MKALPAKFIAAHNWRVLTMQFENDLNTVGEDALTGVFEGQEGREIAAYRNDLLHSIHTINRWSIEMCQRYESQRTLINPPLPREKG